MQRCCRLSITVSFCNWDHYCMIGNFRINCDSSVWHRPYLIRHSPLILSILTLDIRFNLALVCCTIFIFFSHLLRLISDHVDPDLLDDRVFVTVIVMLFQKQVLFHFFLTGSEVASSFFIDDGELAKLCAKVNCPSLQSLSHILLLMLQ